MFVAIYMGCDHGSTLYVTMVVLMMALNWIILKAYSGTGFCNYYLAIFLLHIEASPHYTICVDRVAYM